MHSCWEMNPTTTSISSVAVSSQQKTPAGAFKRRHCSDMIGRPPPQDAFVHRCANNQISRLVRVVCQISNSLAVPPNPIAHPQSRIEILRLVSRSKFRSCRVRSRVVIPIGGGNTSRPEHVAPRVKKYLRSALSIIN